MEGSEVGVIVHKEGVKMISMDKKLKDFELDKCPACNELPEIDYFRNIHEEYFFRFICKNRCLPATSSEPNIDKAKISWNNNCKEHEYLSAVKDIEKITYGDRYFKCKCSDIKYSNKFKYCPKCGCLIDSLIQEISIQFKSIIKNIKINIDTTL